MRLDRFFISTIGLMLLMVLAFLISQGHAQQIESSLGTRPVPPVLPMTGSTGELHFYQMEPTCDHKQAVYLVLPGPLYTEEHHKVWVCGYRR